MHNIVGMPVSIPTYLQAQRFEEICVTVKRVANLYDAKSCVCVCVCVCASERE